jgi:hypothetical protein
VTYPGFTPVGNATLVVANVLTCNKHSHSFSNQFAHPGGASCLTVALRLRCTGMDDVYICPQLFFAWGGQGFEVGAMMTAGSHRRPLFKR